MDLHHLKIYYTACKEKNFTKAAKKLFISQSAVSIQIKRLEETLGIQLIERTSKKFKLTFAGEEMYKMASEIFEKINRMENRIMKIVYTNTNKIVIGATHSVGEPILPELLLEYKKRKPEMEFDIFIKNKESLIRLLKEGEVDLILVNTDYIKGSGLKSIETDDYPYVIVGKSDIKNTEELKTKYFLKKEDDLTMKYMEELNNLKEFDISKSMLVTGSMEATKLLIEDGMGYAILPYYCVHSEVKSGKFKIFHTFNTEVKMKIVFLKENEDKIWIKDFLKFMKDYNLKEIKDENK